MTLMLIPSARQAVIADRPCRAAGMLMNRSGRSTSHHSARASATVRPVSWAIRGSTSIGTRPFTPLVASYTVRSTSHACRTSDVVSSRSAWSTGTWRSFRSRIWPA